MRALLLAYYFPPLGGMGSLRALSLARHLPAAGVDVTVVAPRTGTYGLDPSLVVPPGLRVARTGTLEPNVLLGRATPGGGRVGTPAGPGLATRLVRRLLYVPDPNVLWVPAAVRAALREAARTRPDVVLSSAPPLSANVAAAIVAARVRVPLVADFRDFPSESRLFGDGLRRRLDERIERFVLRRAAATTAASEGIRSLLEDAAGAPSLVVRNGYDEEDFAGEPPDPPEAFRLVHVGSSRAESRDLRPLLLAARDLAETGAELRLRFVGRPDPHLAAAARETGATDLLELRGFTTHAEAIREMRSAPALLLFPFMREEAAVRGMFAGKTLECLRSGRPVLALGPAESETLRFVAERGGALLRESDDRAGIRGALADLLAGRRPAPADPASLAPWSRRAQARLLADWLRERPWS